MGRGDPRPPRGAYHHARWHDWWVCKRCGSVTEDWQVHNDWHDEVDFLTAATGPDETPAGMDGLRERANAEGNAVVGESFIRGGLRQVRDVLRLRPQAES